MAWNNKYSVEITTGGGYTATADDAVTDGVGSSARSLLAAGADITIATATGEIFIPFHAVDHAVITLTRTDDPDPVDPTCQ